MAAQQPRATAQEPPMPLATEPQPLLRSPPSSPFSAFPVRAAIRQLLRLQPQFDLRLALSWREGASFSASLGRPVRKQ
jgi:hypothetical protein